MSCPFCGSNIESTIFARSEHFLAIYNIAPILPGHVLIIPRKHIQSAMEMADSELSEMMAFTKKVTKLLLSIFNVDAFNWSMQENAAAGQSIAHLHFHILPRYPGDLPEPGDWYPKIQTNYEVMLDSENRNKLSKREMSQIIKKLRTAAEERQLYNPG
jgi:bis(5'-adenosyl)-triphosphatase